MKIAGMFGNNEIMISMNKFLNKFDIDIAYDMEEILNNISSINGYSDIEAIIIYEAARSKEQHKKLLYNIRAVLPNILLLWCCKEQERDEQFEAWAFSAVKLNVGVTGYGIYRDGVYVNGTSASTSYTETGLTSGTTYSYYIIAKDAAGNTAKSSTVSGTTKAIDSQAPTAPTGLTAVGYTETTIVLNWNASTDNVGVTGYNIYRDGVYVNGTSTSTSYSS